MEERWAMITGCAGGIGKELMKRFLEEGYHIIAHARKRTEEFEELIRKLGEEYGRQIEPVFFDLTDSEEMGAVMKELRKKKLPVDVCVNNAGMFHAGLFQLTDMQTIRRVYDVNVFAVMELTGYVLKMMARRKKGSIVMITSVTGEDLGIGQCAYGTSKAALAAFVKTLAQETGGLGIRVNAVSPGITDTRMAREPSAKAAAQAYEQDKNPMHRIALPSEIADAVVFLCSEKASFINGQVLRVDGGNHLY